MHNKHTNPIELQQKLRLLPAQKGGTPLNKMYKITPALQTSTCGPYILHSNSGAI